MDTPKIDLSGRVFGKLTAKEYVGKDHRKNSMWKCQCSCGGEKIVKHAHLVAMHTISCGCRHAESLIERNTTHGLSQTKLYERYCGMIARCENPKHISYRSYGKIGIKVCSKWRRDFKSFATWSVNNGYSNELILDRIDSDGDYSPENCRWITRTENNQNARPREGRLYRGIKTKGGKFIAVIYTSNKCVQVGSFEDIKQAVEARNSYIKKNSLKHKIQNIKGA